MADAPCHKPLAECSGDDPSRRRNSALEPAHQRAHPDAVVLQADFGNEPLAAAVLNSMTLLLRIQPALHCILLADNGNEMSAVRALKSGAKDYLPLSQITRDQLLTAVGEACAKRRVAAQAAATMANSENSIIIEVPGYSIVKEIATSNFSSVFLARSDRLRRNVVLKVMARGESERELGDAERFQREYEIISSITHRAIAEIHDFGSLPGHLYLAMNTFHAATCAIGCETVECG